MKKKKRFVASYMLDFDRKISKVTIVDDDGKIQEKLAIRIPEFFAAQKDKILKKLAFSILELAGQVIIDFRITSDKTTLVYTPDECFFPQNGENLSSIRKRIEKLI